jgi:prenyltransferase beta subunit
MSFRLEMLQVARVAPRVLGEAAELVQSFLAQRYLSSGGFGDREGRADLYYTVFGLEGMLAMQMDFDRSRAGDYLRGFGSGEGLDFVHLCCLARCHAALKNQFWSEDERQTFVGRLEAWKSSLGGYHSAKGREWGSAYGCLLVAAAYEDAQIPIPEPERLKLCLDALHTKDGAWNNERHIPLGTAPATAAALCLYRRMSWQTGTEPVRFLFSCFQPEGGCKAFPLAPMPDLLSTAVSLHGLSSAGADVSPLRESCLDYVDSLWSNEGGFHGNWTDHTLDVEYTYYGLLALGHLSM